MTLKITRKEVIHVQEIWANGVVTIGNKFANGEDYISYAENFIDLTYGYSLGDVLFKPTFAAKKQFRLSKIAALSYFIGGNSNYDEDKGFALNMWESIRFENIGIQLNNNLAVAMGNYFFLKDNQETKVEYSFVYKKINNGNLVIILHDSHVPFN